MRKITILVMAGLVMGHSPLHAQCPDRARVNARIIQLKSGGTAHAEQLSELTGYLPSFRKCPVAVDTVYANLMQWIGTLYYFQGDYQSAVDWSLRSIKLAAANPDAPAKAAFLVKVYNNLVLFYDSLHLSRQKMNAVDSCIHVAMRSGIIRNEVIFNVWYRVEYSFNVGDYQRCVDYAKTGEAITHYCTSHEDSLVYVSGFFNFHVNALTLMRKFDEAETILLQRIAEWRGRNDEKNCGVFYNQLAEITNQKKEYDSSLYFLTRSLQCNRAIHFQFYCKQTYNNIGFLYQNHLGQPAKAIQYYYKALECRNNVPTNNVMDVIETLNIYDNIANVFAGRNEFDSAYFYYQQAFAQLRPGVNEQSVLNFSADEFIANSKMQYLVGLIKDKADAYFSQYLFTRDIKCIKRAIATYRIADQVLARVKAEQSESVAGVMWRANARNLYEKAVQACYTVNDIYDAFYFFEKSRAALLNDQLRDQRHSSQEDIHRQVQLKRRLAELKSRLGAAAPASLEYSALQKDIYNTMLENDQVSLIIKKRDPLYYHNYIDSSFISIASLKKNILNGDRSMMEIFYGDSAVYILFASEGQQQLKKISRDDFDRLTATYIKYVSDPALLNRYYDVFIQCSNRLYFLLFDKIDMKPGRLIISPDGQYFPFESLATHNNINAPGFLLYDHPTSYTYSAGFLLNNAVNRADRKYFMGIAPVNFPASTRLPPLAASDGSLLNISSYFSRPDQFVRSGATRNNFLANFSNYRILQLYTHASGGSANEEPEIYFADSSLKLSDIDPVFGAATQLVVLSACETGNGAYYKGEGVFSFNRAFASIGIPSSMVNLWSVDNEAVYGLTELFYKYASRALPLDIALQKAKIEYIKDASRERAMPYYWAAAVIVGKPDPVMPTTTAFTWKPVFAIALLLLAGYLLYYYKRR